MIRAAGLGVRRFVLRTERGPLRPVWALGHRGLARGLGAHVARGRRDAAVYVGGSLGLGRPVYGVSDVDLAVVVPDDPEHPGAASADVRARWTRLGKRFPLLSELVDLDVYEDSDLSDAVGAVTYAHARENGNPRPLYGGPGNPSRIALQERPGLYGPLYGWRRVAGGERRPALPLYDAQERRIAAWAQLQRWWGYAFGGCLNPDGPRTPYLCVKLVAEPARVWLWLAHGEQAFDYRHALEVTLRKLPVEEEALRRALALHSALYRSPQPALEETLPVLARLSARIAARIAEEIAPAGTTDVRLTGSGSDLPLPGDGASGSLLPLADWRARVFPPLADEGLVPTVGDPTDPATLARAAEAGRSGPYPALRSDGLLVLPTAGVREGRARLRSVQSPATDPVSVALVEGRTTAAFPDVPGWSARDCAWRAVVEHRSHLERAAAGTEARGLARPLNGARAALFLEAVAEGDPELALTAAATLRTLADRTPDARSLVEETQAAYRALRLEGTRPPGATVAAFNDLVRTLPAYRQDTPAPPPRRRTHPVTVSVVVAAYDEEEHIGRLLRSLREQSLPPAEVIVVDDGSRDATAAIAEREGARVLRLPHRGPARARNAGADAARGDVLVFLDGDLACAADFLERLVEPIARGHAAGTFSRELYLGNPDRPWARAYATLRGSPPGRLIRADLADRWDNFRAIRRDRFLAVGGYDDVGYGEDMTLAPKVGEQAVVAPGAVLFHHHPATPRAIFENARWIGRGAAIRRLARPWRAHSPIRMVRRMRADVSAGATPLVVPARLVYHAGVWTGLAQSALRPWRHWK